MYESRIIMKCSKKFKDSVKDMAKDRSMNISEFIRFLVEKQKETDKR